MRLPIASFTDPVLRKKVERIDHIDDGLRQLVVDMCETMHAADGIGIAAPQVGRSVALFITCVPVEKPNGSIVPGKDRVYINPEILSMSEETQTFSEGCLSFPNLYMEVTRPETITVKATDLSGQSFQQTLSGFEATNFMHEYDHLQGILIIDYFSLAERRSFEELFRASIENEKKAKKTG